MGIGEAFEFEKTGRIDPEPVLPPWAMPNEHGERPGDICCQRATGSKCYEHDPANWRTVNGEWVNMVTD